MALVADHGEEFGDHGALHHSHTLFEELVHVPCMLMLPGESARASGISAGLVDVAPTLLKAMGLAPLPRANGRTLIGPGAAAAQVPRLTMRCYQDGHHLAAVRAGPWKLACELADRGGPLRSILGASPGEAKLSLYRLESDPGELADVVAEHPERAAELWSVLQALVQGSADRRLRDGLEAALGGAPSGDEEIDPRVRADLRAFGYSDSVPGDANSGHGDSGDER